MARPRKQQPQQTETTPSEASEPAETGGAGVNGNKLPTKTEMVYQAMTVGRKRKPVAIQEWIMEKYGVPRDYVDTGHVSTIKSNLRKGGKKPRKAGDVGDAPAPGRRNGADSLSVDEIRVVKGFMLRLGASKFRELVDLLS